MGRRALLQRFGPAAPKRISRGIAGGFQPMARPLFCKALMRGLFFVIAGLQYFRVAQTRKAFVPRAVLCITFFDKS
jgi:hypothetical protein